METPGQSMSDVQAKQLLTEVAEIKTTTRARLYASGWQWLVVWSLAFIGAAVTRLVPAWSAVAEVYWLYAAPMALLLTALVSWRFGTRSPVRKRDLPYWIIGLAMTAAGFIVGPMLPPRANIVLVLVVLGLGFATFCWLERVTPAAWLLAALALLSGLLGIVVDDIFELYTAVNFAYGAALGGVIAGMIVQARQ
jgi:hypothetical protein